MIAHSGKLRPSETEGAIGMTGLALGWKDKHGFPILMLDSIHPVSIQFRDIAFKLACRVWIESKPDSFNSLFDDGFVDA